MNLVLLAEAQRRVRRQHLAVRREHTGRPEAHQRKAHVRHVVPALDGPDTLDLRDAVGRVAAPVPPRLERRVAGLEHEVPAGTQRVVDTAQRALPARLVDDRLCDVRGHRRGRPAAEECSRVAVDPPHSLGARLGARDLRARPSRVDTGHSRPRSARSSANVPVPQPTSSTRRAPSSSAIAAYTSRSLRSGSSA